MGKTPYFRKWGETMNKATRLFAFLLLWVLMWVSLPAETVVRLVEFHQFRPSRAGFTFPALS